MERGSVYAYAVGSRLAVALREKRQPRDRRFDPGINSGINLSATGYNLNRLSRLYVPRSS
jgi:hypothetical protein